jgi:hypothetical protein
VSLQKRPAIEEAFKELSRTVDTIAPERKKWVVIDRSYQPEDDLAIYYPEEFSELSSKTPDQLREIHLVKLTFPGCRLIQEVRRRYD